MPQSRDFYNDGLPEYEEIRDALRQSVEKLLDEDFDLIALGGHEQAIAHRLAVYLERHFSGYHTDCEYNRQKHRAKTRPSETEPTRTKMRPDVIVHRRDTAQNVLAIEMKANANPASKEDLLKLKCLNAERGYLYKGTAIVLIHNSIGDMASGALRATIYWYGVANGTITERVAERLEIASNKHSPEVKAILDRRRPLKSRTARNSTRSQRPTHG